MLRAKAILMMATLFLSAGFTAVAGQGRSYEPIIYSGICGASAAAALEGDLFAVADDEGNQLRIYRRDQGSAPLQVIDLTANLALDRRNPETDIEGAARIGDRVYWITSHSRNNSGKQQANRLRFFATRLDHTGGALNLAFVGRPDTDLLAELAASPALQQLDLRSASKLPPKARGGLNIEGLCATPANQLLIGFRNPIPGGEALLVPLWNPAEVIAGQRADFGAPIRLDLEGLGIRDVAYWQGTYLIVAGSYDGGGKSKLFRWSGGEAKPKQIKDVDLKGLNPEALVIYPDKGLEEIQLLSDDSSRKNSGAACKDLIPSARTFRAVWVRMDPQNRRKLSRPSRQESSVEQGARLGQMLAR